MRITNACLLAGINENVDVLPPWKELREEELIQLKWIFDAIRKMNVGERLSNLKIAYYQSCCLRLGRLLAGIQEIWGHYDEYHEAIKPYFKDFAGNIEALGKAKSAYEKSHQFDNCEKLKRFDSLAQHVASMQDFFDTLCSTRSGCECAIRKIRKGHRWYSGLLKGLCWFMGITIIAIMGAVANVVIQNYWQDVKFGARQVINEVGDLNKDYAVKASNVKGVVRPATGQKPAEGKRAD